MAKPYSSIADYGLIGNTRTAALISKSGSLDWCCFPLFDSPSFFGAILDSTKGGHFSIMPQKKYTSSQSYLHDTNILETKFKTNTGEVRLIDFFPVDSEINKQGELWPLHEILRIVEGVSGELEMEMIFVPKPKYGSKKVKIKNIKKFGLRCDLGNEIVFLHHELSNQNIIISPDESSATSSFKVKEGQKIIFSMTYSNEAPAVLAALGEHALKRMKRTENYWRDWISKCNYSGEYEKDIRRSALLLKLLTFAPSGAIIAAPTTSLPEELYGPLNWDYRYCWLRDAALTMRALVELGFYQEAEAYIHWILHTTSLTRPRLQVVYTVYGEANIPEKILSWLSGYKNSYPVRIGNAADDQFQLDVYGEVMNALYIFIPNMEEKDLDIDTISFIIDMGREVCRVWNLPDKGIWEVRSNEVHHTHSKAMAWVALDRLIKICQFLKLNCPLDEFTKTADEIKKDIEKFGYDQELRSYTAIYGQKDIDASLLMMFLMDYKSNFPERITSTIFEIEKNLSENGLLYRYKNHDDTSTKREGAFGACSFWLVEAFAKQGMIQEAEGLLRSLIIKINSVGLWSEEMSPETDQYLGNYPQTFTHTAFIGAVLSLKKAKNNVAQ